MKFSDSLQKIISFSQMQSQRVDEADDSGRKSPSFPSFQRLNGRREAKYRDKLEKRVAKMPLNQTDNPVQTQKDKPMTRSFSDRSKESLVNVKQKKQDTVKYLP